MKWMLSRNLDSSLPARMARSCATAASNRAFAAAFWVVRSAQLAVGAAVVDVVELVLSERTVHHHLEHVYQKIGVSTRAAAALFAMQHHLVEPDDTEATA